MQLEHTDLLVQVESLMNQSTAQTDDATDAHSASARRLDQLWTVGTTVGVGCFTIADGSNDYNVGSAACNSLNCPSCFITPSLTQHSTLIIDSCDSHYWGITGTTARSGVWMYTFINTHATYKLTVSTKNGGSAIAGNTFIVPALSSITAYCKTGGAGQLYFPSTTLPQLTVEGAATLSSTLAVSGTSTLSGAVGLSGALTMSGANGITMNGGALTVGSNGNFVQSGTGTFSTGTGAVSLNGDVTVATTKSLELAGSGGSGGITIAGAGNFVMGTGSISSTSPSPAPAVTFASNVVLASGMGLTLAGAGGITMGGSGAFNMGSSSGAFTSGTGIVSLKGATTVASSKTLSTPTLSLATASITCGYTDIITGSVTTPGSNLCTDSGR